MLPEEQEFFKKVYRETYPSLYSYAAKMLNLKGFPHKMIPDLAEELIQDACHSAAKKIKSMTASPNPPGWLMNVLKFKFKEFMRQVNSDNQRLLYINDLPRELPHHSDDPAAVLSDMEYADTMKDIRKHISADDFRLFEMVALNHVSHRAAAEEFGITVWASQKRVERARKEIKKFLQ